MKFELEKNIVIKKVYNIIAYEILSISIKPNIRANLDIMIYCDDNQLYSRQFLLEHELYLNWTTDDYLPYIIGLNLENIFNDN